MKMMIPIQVSALNMICEANMNPVVLIQLSENDKRIIIALFLVLILVFVIIGIIGSIIVRVMKWQGKKCDTLVSDVVVNHIIEKPGQLRRYARKKNIRYFIKQAWIPILLIVAGVIVLVIRGAVTNDWAYDPFNMETGFGTLFFAWDFGNDKYYTMIFDLKLLAEWPELINTPHAVVEAIYSYISIPLLFIGGLWYLVVAQAYLARTIRAIKLSKTVFEKSLDDFNKSTPSPVQPLNDNSENNQ